MITKNKFYCFSLQIFICFFITSCILSPTPFRKVKLHDLGTPALINKQGPYVNFTRFTLNGPYKTKMVFRAKNNELVVNEYHKWGQPPDALIERYLILAFRGKPASAKEQYYSVRGRILAFEADEETGKAVLIIEYNVKAPLHGKKKSFCRTLFADMKQNTPDCFAVAMSEIAAKLAIQLKHDILSLK